MGENSITGLIQEQSCGNRDAILRLKAVCWKTIASLAQYRIGSSIVRVSQNIGIDWLGKRLDHKDLPRCLPLPQQTQTLFERDCQGLGADVGLGEVAAVATGRQRPDKCGKTPSTCVCVCASTTGVEAKDLP